ncbi:MAG: protein phosphatase 2C domain-containing protein [Verrucomicrobiota bacterium]
MVLFLFAVGRVLGEEVVVPESPNPSHDWISEYGGHCEFGQLYQPLSCSFFLTNIPEITYFTEYPFLEGTTFEQDWSSFFQNDKLDSINFCSLDHYSEESRFFWEQIELLKLIFPNVDQTLGNEIDEPMLELTEEVIDGRLENGSAVRLWFSGKLRLWLSWFEWRDWYLLFHTGLMLASLFYSLSFAWKKKRAMASFQERRGEVSQEKEERDLPPEPFLPKLDLSNWVNPGEWNPALPVPNPQTYLHVFAGTENAFLLGDVTTGPWSAGVFSYEGNSRAENQDVALSFSLPSGEQVFVLADGLGGVPHGRRASRIAVVAAARSLVASSLQQNDSSPKQWLHPAIVEAQRAIRTQSELMKIDPNNPRSGLQTTLIIAVTTPETVYYQMLGDGGFFLINNDGEIHELARPQKGEASNQVGGCLGPNPQGRPIAGEWDRTPGDVVFFGTDGAFDVYADRNDFVNAARFELAKVSDGDLDKFISHLVIEIAGWGPGYTDDNITLAAIGTGNAPAFVTQSPQAAIEEQGNRKSRPEPQSPTNNGNRNNHLQPIPNRYEPTPFHR